MASAVLNFAAAFEQQGVSCIKGVPFYLCGFLPYNGLTLTGFRH